MKSNLIDHFITQLQRRLNQSTALRLVSLTLAGTGVLLVLHAVFYRYQGESVPWPAAMGLIVCGSLLALGGWFLRRVKKSEAARVGDRELGLKDSLTSALSFNRAHQEGEVYELQQHAAETLLEGRNAREIPLSYSRYGMVGGIILTALAIWMGFLSPSDAVQQRLEKESLTETRTEEIRKELEKAIDELTKDLSEEEKEVLKPHELKQWVKELKATKSQKEALKQLARFEQKISKAMAGMDARKDEESLKLAALELSKSDQAAARKLGKQLDDKQFKLVAENLKKAAEKTKTKKKANNLNKFNKEQLKKLREMTQRMANAARKRAAGKPTKLDGKMSRHMAKGKEMDQLLKEMDAAAAAAEKMAELDPAEMGEGDLEKMQLAEGAFDQQMQRMMRRLKKLDAKHKMKKKLSGLRAGLSRAQQYAMGKGAAPSAGRMMAQAKGPGKGIGVGSEKSRRKQRDELKDNKNFAELKGQHGSGPSITAVEDAQSGSGVSNRRGAGKERNFQRQLESFVRRDDVPDDVKLGVKDYFEKVHQVKQP